MGNEKTRAIREESAPAIEYQIFISLAENSTEFIGISDLNLKPIYVNPAGLRRVGLDDFAQAAQTSVPDFFFPEDRAFIENEFFRQIHEEGRGEVEIRFRHFKTGEPLWMIYTVFIVRDEAGAPLGYGTVSRDITERKKIEEEKNELGRRNRSILESITDAFFALDRDWRFTYVNPQAETVLEREPGDLIGKILWEVYPGLSGSEFETAYRAAMNERTPATVTAYYPDHERWYEVHAYPASDGITIYFRNITERVRTEENLRRIQHDTERRRRLYDTILSTTPDLVYVFDLDHRFTYANEVLLQMWGKTWDEAIGKNCLELGYEPWHAEMHDREIEQVKRTGQPIRGEVPFAGTFGRRIYDYIFVPIFGADGEVEAVAGTTRDVTERKQIENRSRFVMQIDEAVRPLETPEEVTQTLARLLGEYLGADRCAYAEVERDENHFYIPGDYTRGAMHSIVGRYAMSDFGAEVLRLMRENKPYVVNDVDNDPQVAKPDLAAYRQTGIQAVICVPLHKNGRFAACMAVHQKVPRQWTTEEIELVSFVSNRFWESIERARIIKSLNESFIREHEARESAEAANRVKDEFLATLSHELRTPLNAILGWSTMLRGGTLNEQEAARALETVERSARAQSQLIEDLLDISRIITGNLRLEIRSIDPAKVIEAAVDAVRPAAAAKRIELEVALDSDVATISADPARLQQIVWNLLSNAVKFTARAGRVNLRLERVESHLEISVSDSGKGIAAEFLPFIFDRFRQADQTTTRRQGGLGLGLSIVHQLVEMHGGTIQAESEGDGRGAKFIVRLPLASVVSGDVGEDSRPARGATEDRFGFYEAQDLKGLRVLVVDDEIDSRSLLGIVLEQSGAEAALAASAGEVLEALETDSFDLLISDIGMPNEDGYELIGKIRRLPAKKGGRIPAIALTAYARLEDRVRALNAGFQAHIAKPVEPVELVAVVASLARGVRKK
jgi:PAS domain S-box-containing protein